MKISRVYPSIFLYISGYKKNKKILLTQNITYDRIIFVSGNDRETQNNKNKDISNRIEKIVKSYAITHDGVKKVVRL